MVMKHETDITGITLRVEFKAFGRIAYIEVDTDMIMLSNSARLRTHIDDSISRFLDQNNPLRVRN